MNNFSCKDVFCLLDPDRPGGAGPTYILRFLNVTEACSVEFKSSGNTALVLFGEIAGRMTVVFRTRFKDCRAGGLASMPVPCSRLNDLIQEQRLRSSPILSAWGINLAELLRLIAQTAITLEHSQETVEEAV